MNRSKPLSRKTPLRRTDSLRNAKHVDGEKAQRQTRHKRRPISPASPAQRAKVKGLPCLACGREQTEWLAIDPAHVIARSLGGCSSPDCVVPLCRTFDGTSCHREFDEGRLDLLPLLEHEGRWRVEQAHAVMHVGIALAYRHTTNDRSVAA